jgi:hypothetical protein
MAIAILGQKSSFSPVEKYSLVENSLLCEIFVVEREMISGIAVNSWSFPHNK